MTTTAHLALIAEHCFHGDANAALTLVEAARKAGWRCRHENGLDGTWECEFYRDPKPNTHKDDIGTMHGERMEILYAAAYTLPGAICLAYLKTLQHHA